MPENQDDSQWSPWPDEQAWLDFLEPMLLDNYEFADTASRLFLRLIEEIEKGPAGAKHTVDSLETALRVIFPYTEVCREARELYRLSLAGETAPKDEPLTLLRKAIERTTKRQH